LAHDVCDLSVGDAGLVLDVEAVGDCSHRVAHDRLLLPGIG
jgi:hypothetical protein